MGTKISKQKLETESELLGDYRQLYYQTKRLSEWARDEKTLGGGTPVQYQLIPFTVVDGEQKIKLKILTLIPLTGASPHQNQKWFPRCQVNDWQLIPYVNTLQPHRDSKILTMLIPLRNLSDEQYSHLEKLQQELDSRFKQIFYRGRNPGIYGFQYTKIDGFRITKQGVKEQQFVMCKLITFASGSIITEKGLENKFDVEEKYAIISKVVRWKELHKELKLDFVDIAPVFWFTVPDYVDFCYFSVFVYLLRYIGWYDGTEVHSIMDLVEDNTED